MRYRLTFTAGIGKTHDGRSIDEVTARRRVGLIRRGLAEGFGGYTETSARGGWIDSAGQLVEEPARTWTVFTERNALAEGTAQWIADVLEQESVVMTEELLTHAARFIGRSSAEVAHG